MVSPQLSVIKVILQVTMTFEEKNCRHKGSDPLSPKCNILSLVPGNVLLWPGHLVTYLLIQQIFIIITICQVLDCLSSLMTSKFKNGVYALPRVSFSLSLLQQSLGLVTGSSCFHRTIYLI